MLLSISVLSLYVSGSGKRGKMQFFVIGQNSRLGRDFEKKIQHPEVYYLLHSLVLNTRIRAPQ